MQLASACLRISTSGNRPYICPDCNAELPACSAAAVSHMTNCAPLQDMIAVERTGNGKMQREVGVVCAAASFPTGIRIGILAGIVADLLLNNIST